MDRNLSLIKERILYLTDYHKDKKEDFFKKIGVTYGNFKGMQKETSVSSDTIEKILSIYPNVNSDWLLTGKGDVFKRNEVDTAVIKEYDTEAFPYYLGLDVHYKLINDLQYTSEEIGDFFKEIRTVKVFPFILKGFLQAYFSRYEAAFENKDQFLKNSNFDYNGYRRNVTLELRKLLKFRPAFKEFEKAIYNFYDELRKYDDKDIIKDMFYDVKRAKEIAANNEMHAENKNAHI